MKTNRLVALFVGVVGCGHATAPTVDLSGYYCLETMNGRILPVAVGDSTTLISSVITLSSKGSYQEIVTMQIKGAQQVISIHGYYANNGRFIVVQPSVGSAFTLNIDGDYLTENDNAGTLVYRKQP